jgi:indolepyruvate ferredoxin oxidoreductase
MVDKQIDTTSSPITDTKIEFNLSDRYTRETGRIVLNGIQALVRLPVDQHRADQRRNLNTGTLIAGYRGSPVGGLDSALERESTLMNQHNIHFIPAVNEELAATAIMGSQTANLLPNPKYDGVLGMWYGKGPGVDRSGDAFKHGNYAGIGQYGGVLAVAGDDPSAKSSTIPSHSEVALYDALMPTLYPGNVQEILDYGRIGFELSRYSGLWVGFKIVTNVADEYSSVDVAPDRVTISDPEFTINGQPWKPSQNTNLLASQSLPLEKEIHERRLEAALAFARKNNINQITVASSKAWLGIIAAGKTYYDLREALLDIGLYDAELEKFGIRLLKLGMTFPVEPEILNTFADGLEEILVIEEKRSFIEMFCKDLLYGASNTPRIVGKKDETGRKLVPSDNELDADAIVRILARRLEERVQLPQLEKRLSDLSLLPNLGTIPVISRQPYFCSGCPHNRSTLVPEGSIASAGIGCHTMTLMMDRDTSGVTQMGGEGANWVGASFFTETPHMFQNIGDGTFAHSGSLAVRQAIATGANITYKILYNSAVAMTGGQDADGNMPVPELTRMLDAEGVKKIIVISSDPSKFPPQTKWADGAQVWDRDRLDEAQKLLRDVEGVTVLIYDQECAANLRRKRKRGYVPDPALRVFINEAVCEGCGDCGVKSNCLSVQPVETEFGRKTQIHQSSCNKDYTCLDGNCPAFITVIPDENQPAKQQKMFIVDRHIPEPQRKTRDSSNVFLMGIGGTGVVTSNQIIGTAAVLDGFHIRALDQTGLSQKGGPVVSNLKIMTTPTDISNKIANGTSDAFLVFDVLTATSPKNLLRANPNRSIAIVSTSKVPTGEMVRDTTVAFPEKDRLLEIINGQTRAGDNVYFDAIGLAESLFDNHMMANMIVVGAAYQSGLFPMSAESVETAIELNGVKVEENRHAFRVGRLAVADPQWLASLEVEDKSEAQIQPEVSPTARQLIDQVGAEGELERLLKIRVPELIAYQNEAYAQQYINDVKAVYDKELNVCNGDTALSEAVARHLFKLMAYKDEYEVARLSLKSEVHQAMNEQFGQNATIHYNLHPPILKAFGVKKKLKFGRWFDHAYRLLIRMKGLRGTALDIFGYDHVRKVERSLIPQYRQLVFSALDTLTPETYSQVVKLASLPDMIRGYDEIKLDNVEKFWDEVTKLGYPDLRKS